MSNNPKHSKVLNAAIMEIVSNQLRQGNPPQTRATFDRLVASGLPEQEVRRLIACVVINEMWTITKGGKAYEAARYIAALERLPEMPEGWDE